MNSFKVVKDKVGIETDFNLHLENAKKRSSRYIKLYCEQNTPDSLCLKEDALKAINFANTMCEEGLSDIQPVDYCHFE